MNLPDEMCASAEADVGTPSTWHSSRHSSAALERVPSSWPCGTLRKAVGGRSVCDDVFVHVTGTGNVRCLFVCVRMRNCLCLRICGVDAVGNYAFV